MEKRMKAESCPSIRKAVGRLQFFTPSKGLSLLHTIWPLSCERVFSFSEGSFSRHWTTLFSWWDLTQPVSRAFCLVSSSIGDEKITLPRPDDIKIPSQKVIFLLLRRTKIPVHMTMANGHYHYSSDESPAPGNFITRTLSTEVQAETVDMCTCSKKSGNIRRRQFIWIRL
jgi:hypothetical protein